MWSVSSECESEPEKESQKIKVRKQTGSQTQIGKTQLWVIKLLLAPLVVCPSPVLGH